MNFIDFIYNSEQVWTSHGALTSAVTCDVTLFDLDVTSFDLDVTAFDLCLEAKSFKESNKNSLCIMILMLILPIMTVSDGLLYNEIKALACRALLVQIMHWGCW